MEYDLCPQVPMAAIVEQTRQAILHLWRKTGRRVIPFGHSAGGHLTALALAVNWKAFDPKAPGDLTPGGLAISGLFDLRPLVGTSINTALGLTETEAWRLSPWPMCRRPDARSLPPWAETRARNISARPAPSAMPGHRMAWRQASSSWPAPTTLR